MSEEPAVTSRKKIATRAYLSVVFSVVMVVFVVFSYWQFASRMQKSLFDDTTTSAELEPSASEPIAGVTSRPVQPSTSQDEQMTVLHSRKAGCKTIADASALKLQQTLELMKVRATLLNDLRSNDTGRRVAASDDLIEMFLALCEVDLPTTIDIEETQVVLDELQTKLQLLRSGYDLQKVDQLRIELKQINGFSQQTLDQMTRAKRDLDALLLLAERETVSAKTLSEAADRYELQITANHQLKLTKAKRSAREQQLAEEEAKAEEFHREIASLRTKISDSHRRVQFSEEKAKQEFAKRAEAKRKLEVEFQRDLPDIRSLLKPFITPGRTQHLHKFAYRPDSNPNPRPVSLGSLEALGYLHDSTERLTAFWRSTSHENDRAFGSFPKAPYGKTVITHELEAVRRAQGYLKRYSDLMVEKGMLSP